MEVTLVIAILALIYLSCKITIGVEAALGFQFHNGRHVKGFLGYPSKFSSIGRDDDVIDLWFEQRLDHFDDSNPTRWLQRYFVNDAYYRNDSNAPVFLMISGEAEASKKWMKEGAWIHYAEHFGAMCIQVEHRFYGKSRPTSDLSTKHLSYLTSEQALADLAAFIIAMKIHYNMKDSQKWIAFGGSYPGSLAAWAREKYPYLVYGAISSSGPLLAKVNFKEYFEVVKMSLNNYNSDCTEAVKRSFVQIGILLKNWIGQRNIDKQFKTCTPIKDSVGNQLDIANFFETLASNLAGVVQYNKDNSPHANITIDEVCNVMTNMKLGPPVTRLATVNEMMLYLSKEKCLDYKYDKMINEMKNISWESEAANGMRQWIFQTCNEFGFYQTSENRNDLFGGRFDVNFFIQQCQDIYSYKMNAAYLNRVVSLTNKNYGALKPNTTNVLYVHGSIDPWHALGLIKSNNVNVPILYINGTAHCANMYEPLKSDPPQLVAARNKIITFLAKLLDSFSLV